MISRRAVLAGLAVGVGAPVWAEAPLRSLRPVARARSAPSPAVDAPPLRADLESLVQAANLGDGVGFQVIDLSSGAVLAARRPDLAQPPASVTKAVTSLYALGALPRDYRFATSVLATGPVVGGVVQGDLVLRGGGDPTLDTTALDHLAQALAARGVTGVTGRFLVWGGALPYAEEIEPSQLDHLGYNPAVSGLNLNFNRVHFEWRRSGGAYRTTLEARSDTLRPAVGLAQVQIVDRKAPIYDSSAPDHWSVARHALGKGGARWLPVRQPALYAAEVFTVLARSHGVTLPPAQRSAQPGEGEVLAEQLSAPLPQVVHGMLKHSTNLTAEVLGLTASKRAGAMPPDLAQSAAQMTTWLGQPGAAFVDHSGLDDDNRISAAAMAQVLGRAGAYEALWPLLKVIPIRDAPAYPGEVRAKTGTLNFVSALAGYAVTAQGRVLGFAIFCADLERRARAIASAEEVPAGSVSWNARAKILQDQLLRRWLLRS